MDFSANEFEMYGHLWEEGTSRLTIELKCFREGLTPEEGGLGKEGHFKEVVRILWSPDFFTWNPWADRMLKESCRESYLAVAGCASSGKTRFFAVYAVVNFLADPANTMVLVTSTSLKDSRRRIWGDVELAWNALPDSVQVVGKLTSSTGVIKYVDEKGNSSERAGLALLAGEEKEAKESVRKLIGYKQHRVILIADELPELSEAIIQAALGNLNSNPSFQLVGIGNPASYYDAFGVFAEPLAGFKSLSPEMDEWQTRYGKCIRFDGMKSPNVEAGEEKYRGILTLAKIQQIAENLGADSPQFWRMVRGFWSPAGAMATVYSESEFLMAEAEETIAWMTPPTRLGALDASFSENGDRAQAWFASLGTSVQGQVVLQFDPSGHELREEVGLSATVPRDYQIARQFRDLCLKNGVTPKCAAIDSTGAGGPFSSILAMEWDPAFLKVYFGGAPSERTVSSSDPRTGVEAYENRVTEIWFAMKEYLRTHQIKGLSRAAIKEMVARLYSTAKKGGQIKVLVESKKQMKMRTDASPDVADTHFILLDLARTRFGFESGERKTSRLKREDRSMGGGLEGTLGEGVNLPRYEAPPSTSGDPFPGFPEPKPLREAPTLFGYDL